MSLRVMDGGMETGAPDMAVDSDRIPWVPQGERVWYKPLRFDVANGRWVNLLKVAGQGQVNRHRHSSQVLGYCLKGQWHYPERDWVARPGTFIYEPPGDVHTLVVDSSDEMITFFALEGVIEYLNEADQVIYQDNVFTKLNRYLEFCRANDIEPLDLRY